MGEEMADTLEDEVEVKGSTAGAETPMNASISFGRFENDLLCWDRWSSFSQNKSGAKSLCRSMPLNKFLNWPSPIGTSSRIIEAVS
ncbi:hypothetical protein Sjap_009067 [Stephania japonica]|uniref:Uncharacterized protein n=1 Tax=Stephania japonica TaxID=461633 RepID=A0AAP0PBF4_9MAGN